jgi:hypothetical protein
VKNFKYINKRVRINNYKVALINPGYGSYRFEPEILEPVVAEIIIDR